MSPNRARPGIVITTGSNIRIQTPNKNSSTIGSAQNRAAVLVKPVSTLAAARPHNVPEMQRMAQSRGIHKAAANSA